MVGRLTFSIAVLLFSSKLLVGGQLITPAPRLSWLENGLAGPEAGALVGQPPKNLLAKREHTNCDGVGTFMCPVGTCYTGVDGFIGCCSVSSCRARTTCIEYNPTSRTDCDPETGGCVVCDNPMNPFCVTISNMMWDQYIMYCGSARTKITVNYDNLIRTGSTDLAFLTGSNDVDTTVTRTTIPSTAGLSTSKPPESTSDSILGLTSSGAATESSNVAPATSIFDDSSESSSISTGAIAGISIGSALFASLILFLLYWYILRPRLLRSTQTSNPVHSEKGNTGGQTRIPDPFPSPFARDGIAISEIEGSSPDPLQQPWSPTSLNPYPSNPELDATHHATLTNLRGPRFTVDDFPDAERTVSQVTMVAPLSQDQPGKSTASSTDQRGISREISSQAALPLSPTVSSVEEPSPSPLIPSFPQTVGRSDSTPAVMRLPETTYVAYRPSETTNIQTGPSSSHWGKRSSSRYLSPETALAEGLWMDEQGSEGEKADANGEQICQTRPDEQHKPEARLIHEVAAQ